MTASFGARPGGGDLYVEQPPEVAGEVHAVTDNGERSRRVRRALTGGAGGVVGAALLYPVAIFGGVPGVLIWLLWWVLVVLTGFALASRHRPLGIGVSAGAALLLLAVTMVAALVG